MPLASLDSLLAYLRENGLLEPQVLQQMDDLRARFPNAAEWLCEVEKHGWLTAFQSQRLLEGKPLVLGNYLLLDWLGRGGMGEVFKARHRNLNRLAAVKIIRNLSDAELVKRFHREARAAASLNHPNIVTIYDADEDQGIYFFAMEYVEGTDLGKILRVHGALPIATACQFVRQAALGLQHAHEHGLIHRDIKPSNLIVTAADQDTPLLKILDFGLARVDSEHDESGLTPTGHWLGTPEFIAPEQACDSSRADIRSDIFSLGCVAFALLSGRSPFAGSNSTEKLAARLTTEAPPLRSVRAEVPAGLEAVVQRMLAREPAARHQTPREVAEGLLAWCAAEPLTIDVADVLTQSLRPADSRDTEPLPQASPSRPEPVRQLHNSSSTAPITVAPSAKRKWWLAIAAGLAVIGMLVWPAYLLWRPRQDQPDPPKDQPQAKPKELPKPLDNRFVNSINMELVRIPAGKFMMGADNEPEQDEDERPRHEVVIARPFYLGKYEVTQEEYFRMMGKNPSYFSAEGKGRMQVWERKTDRHPVENVSWEMAELFCRLLSRLPEEKAVGRSYRLPTEEEWEYACRAGTKGPFHFGDSLSSTQANFNGERPYGAAAKGVNRPHTMPVGSFPANAFGLYDMHGNVWEWCQDPYIRYADKLQKVFPGPGALQNRVLRGGGWFFSGTDCRSAKRAFRHPANTEQYHGFRVACDVAGEVGKK